MPLRIKYQTELGFGEGEREACKWCNGAAGGRDLLMKEPQYVTHASLFWLFEGFSRRQADRSEGGREDRHFIDPDRILGGGKGWCSKE